MFPFFFHEVTSLHPPSFQRNDFSTCVLLAPPSVLSVRSMVLVLCMAAIKVNMYITHNYINHHVKEG